MYSPEELKRAGLDDFRVFLVHVWAFLQLPKPTPVQLDIARLLQHGPKRLILSAFRGVGKSWITAAFVCWLLLHNPQLKIIVVSASQQLADDMSKFIKQLIHGMPVLQHLAPRAGQRDSSIKFDVGPALESKDPSVKSVGITGQITGSRGDVIIPDDVEIPKNSQTHLMREKLAELVKEFDAILKPGGRIIYLGTPQVEDSLYMKLVGRMDSEGKPVYQMSVYPVEIPEHPENYAGRLADFVQRRVDAGWEPKTPIEPGRFPRQDLMERRGSYGLSGYALQFMLDVNPTSQDKRPLKIRDLMIYDVDRELGPVRLVWGSTRETVINDLPSGGFDGDFYLRPAWVSPEMSKYQGTVMAIDPSGKGKDETAYAIVRYANGLLYLVASGGFLDGYGEATLKAIAEAAREHGVNDIIAEENYGGGMFNKLLEPWLIKVGGGDKGKLAGRIDYEWKAWSSGMKEHRICDTLEPILRSHKLVVDRRVIEADRAIQERTPAYSLVWQLTRMERLKGALPHEDRLEALAMACGYWTERMNRDQDRAVQDHRTKALKEELKNFRKHVFNIRPKRDRRK